MRDGCVNCDCTEGSRRYLQSNGIWDYVIVVSPPMTYTTGMGVVGIPGTGENTTISFGVYAENIIDLDTERKVNMPVMKRRNKIIMLRGLPASGKTTFAKEMIRDHPWEIKRVSKDDIRAMVQNGMYTEDSEHFILEIRDFIVAKAIERGKDVVVDDTNMNPKHKHQLREIAYSIDAIFEMVDIDTSVAVCVQRDVLRSKPVGEDVIRRMANKYAGAATRTDMKRGNDDRNC